MKNIKTIVKTSSKSYPIYIGNNNINITGNLISKKMPNAKKRVTAAEINCCKNHIAKKYNCCQK